MKYEGRTYDTGSKIGFLMANVAYALERDGPRPGLPGRSSRRFLGQGVRTDRAGSATARASSLGRAGALRRPWRTSSAPHRSHAAVLKRRHGARNPQIDPAAGARLGAADAGDRARRPWRPDGRDRRTGSATPSPPPSTRIAARQGPRHRHRHGQVRATSAARSPRPSPRPARPPITSIPAEASHGDLGMVQPDDVISPCPGRARRRSSPTSSPMPSASGCRSSPSRRARLDPRAAGGRLPLPAARPRRPARTGLRPTTSTTMQLALGDALAIALLEQRGFTAEHFRVFHPGGKLGAQLRLVRDVMHKGERLPIVRDRHAAWTRPSPRSARKGFGCVIVVDAGRHARRHRHGRRPAP